MPDAPEPPEEIGAVDEPGFLVEQYVTGRLRGDEARLLLELLVANPGLGASLLDQLNVDTMLRGLNRAAIRDEGHPSPATGDAGGAAREPRWGGRRPSWPGKALSWVAAAAACVALVVILGVRSKRDAGQGARWAGDRDSLPIAAAEATTAAVAVLARTVDAHWADPAHSHKDGSPLNPGRLSLKAGLAEVEFFSGARVVLEGPGELDLRSPVEAFCPAGRLSAEVPPAARGFRIGTPGGSVVDLGTAFGLDVTGAGAEVHVFKGKVELHPGARSTRGLREGEAAALGGNGRVRLFKADPSAFTTPSIMERKAAEASGRRYAAWRKTASLRNADPDLVVRLDFEGLGPDDRTLPNRASAGSAAIVGCGRADGRWPGKGALEFRGVSDRVRLEVPGEMSSLTLAAWVSVNGLDRRFNSLFMADAFRPGAAHWQILNDGRVRLGVASRDKPGHVNYDSPVVFSPERLGRWVHLAVVVDAGRRQVVHYVDGRAVSREPSGSLGPLRIGPAELGNWNSGARSDRVPIRHYSGRIDEFSAYRRALDESEVVALCTVDPGPDDR